MMVEDLDKKRGEAVKELALRQGEPAAKITVHMGECGIAAGARDVMDTLLTELAGIDRTDIHVFAAGCIEKCAFEPIVAVEIHDSQKTFYQKMDPVKIRQVLEKHVLKGQVQSDLLLPPA